MANQSAQELNPFAPPQSDVDSGVASSLESDVDARLADRGTRLGAAILDGLLYLLAAIPAAIFFFYSLVDRKDQGAMAVVGMMLLLCVLALAIYQWVRTARTGQTLAKKWLGIKIVKMDGSPVDFVSGVLMRVWVPAAISFVIGLVMGATSSKGGLNVFAFMDAVVIFGGARRCLHDYIAGTKVIIAS